MSTDPVNPEEPEKLPSAPPISGAEASGAAPGSNRMLWIGLGAGAVLYAFMLAITLALGTGDQGYWALNLIGLMVVVTFVVLIAGIVMAAQPRVRKLGIGLLISIAAGLIIDGGTCIALLRAGV